jgi:hypothetical protein
MKLSRSAIALSLACLSTTTSVVLSPAVIAQTVTSSQRRPQLFSQTFPGSVVIPAGTVLPVRFEGAEKIVLATDETLPITLTLDSNVRTSTGQVLIPAGSQIQGEFRPSNGGTQFLAESITPTNSNTLPLNASSNRITETETIRRGSRVRDILTGAAIGGAAAAVIAEITGSIDVGEVLGGAGLGALGGLIRDSRQRAEVFVVRPEEDLRLTLDSDLVLSR